MSTILFECHVTEFHIIPPKENEENCFVLNEKAMIINFMDINEKILMQSEISRDDALQLAKLITLKYS